MIAWIEREGKSGVILMAYVDDENPVHMGVLVNDVLNLISSYGQIDGADHKAWVIDQIVRVLTGPAYYDFINCYKEGEDGPETYEWDEGVAP